MATLEYDSHGPEVEALQNALVAQGYYVGTVDGKYGNRTAAAVAYFQSCNGLTIDGIAGPQTQQMLGIDHHAGAVEMTLPAADAVTGDHYAVTVNVSHATHVRVVVWFTAGTTQVNTEGSVDAQPGAAATVTVEIPTDIRAHEDEVHVTAYAFDQQGTQLDEKAGSFWMNRQ
jgi:peptidoglycan hydrolase-like protein with peptidoglycan-binding domain